MLLRRPVDRLAAVSIAIVLTVLLGPGTAAQTQAPNAQQSNVDAARALLTQAIAQERETPTKESAEAAQQALDTYNAALASAQPSAPRGPSDGVGINTNMLPTILFEAEPNNTSGTAGSIAAALTAARYVMVVGEINPGGDVDVLSFTASANSRIWIETDTGGVQNAGATSRDTVMELLAADGTTVIETDDDHGTGNGGDGINETGLASIIAGRTLTVAGTYYIRIRAFNASSIITPYRLFVVNTTATAVAEVEGNNTAASANVGVPVSGSLGLHSGAVTAGDFDYYSVAATAGSIVYFAVDGDPERDGTGTDVVVELRSPADVLLIAVDSEITGGSLADPSAEGANFTILSDGVYYVRVRHFNAVGTGTYHLMTAVSTPAEDEPNSTAGTAEAIDFSSTARRAAIISGVITPGDIDFYSFQAPAGSRVWIETDTGGVQNTGATSRDTKIDLLASDGVTVIENDDDDGTGNGSDGSIETGLASMIAGRILTAGGTYYISVQAFSGTGIINPYKLFVVVTNSAPRGEVEANDTGFTPNALATTASPLGIRSGAIGAAGDVDYYSIAGTAGAMLYFNVDADPERDGVGTDLVVEVRSPADVLLLSVDSSITGSLPNPAAEGGNFILTEDGTYFIKVRHFSASGTGTYDIMAIAASGNGFPAFTNSPLFTGITPVSAVHFTELRTRIGSLRNRFGLPIAVYSHPSLAGAVIETEDLTEMRTALDHAYAAAGRAAPVYTDPVITAGSTVVKAVHIEQLRAAVIELEGS
jgi:hypothetical protein